MEVFVRIADAACDGHGMERDAQPCAVGIAPERRSEILGIVLEERLAGDAAELAENFAHELVVVAAVQREPEVKAYLGERDVNLVVALDVAFFYGNVPAVIFDVHLFLEPVGFLEVPVMVTHAQELVGEDGVDAHVVVEGEHARAAEGVRVVYFDVVLAVVYLVGPVHVVHLDVREFEVGADGEAFLVFVGVALLRGGHGVVDKDRVGQGKRCCAGYQGKEKFTHNRII